MRRKDREITDREKIDQIISSCHCCRLGFCDDGEVYIVPLNFGFSIKEGKRIFYFHGAKEGRKLDLIRQNNTVGFELDTNYHLNEAEAACGYSASFQSVIGTGKISFLHNREEKAAALRAIMLHYTETDEWDFSQASLDSVCVFQLEVEHLSCKEHQ